MLTFSNHSRGSGYPTFSGPGLAEEGSIRLLSPAVWRVLWVWEWSGGVRSLETAESMTCPSPSEFILPWLSPRRILEQYPSSSHPDSLVLWSLQVFGGARLTHQNQWQLTEPESPTPLRQP